MSRTHWKTLTDQNYLGSWDFNPGEERTLTISHVERKELFNLLTNAKKPCIVAYFRENCKPMVLNKTNIKMIEKLYKTPIVEEWSGCRIVVSVERVRSAGELTDGLRIKKQKPPEVQPGKICCADCGNNIESSGEYTAVQIAAAARKRYGLYLCYECGGKRKEKGGDETHNETHS